MECVKVITASFILCLYVLGSFVLLFLYHANIWDKKNVVGILARVMKGRNVYTEMKKGLKNGIFLSTLMYGSEMWTWNRIQQSRIYATEVSSLIGACGDSEDNGSISELFCVVLVQME